MAMWLQLMAKGHILNTFIDSFRSTATDTASKCPYIYANFLMARNSVSHQKDTAVSIAKA